jgi:hypothetical protein
LMLIDNQPTTNMVVLTFGGLGHHPSIILLGVSTCATSQGSDGILHILLLAWTWSGLPKWQLLQCG